MNGQSGQLQAQAGDSFPPLGGQGGRLLVTNDLFSGRQYAFCGQNAFPETIPVQKNGDAALSGALSYYYFTAHPPIDSSSRGLSIGKTLYRYNTATGRWDLLTGSEQLKIGDKIKTELTIQAPRQLQYVFIEDRRAAALEPLDASSGYEYGNAFTYYKSVRDAALQFFAEKIPAGISTLRYETVVSGEGRFTNGPASLQCMYQPAVRAWSGSGILEITP
jgi:uncharacterized protein YfaS (alpha-2-macroglobulin family)